MLTPTVMTFGDGDFGGARLSHEHRALMNGIIALREEAQRTP